MSYAFAYYSSIMFSIELNFVFNQILEDNLNIISIKKDTLIDVLLLIIFMSFFSGIIPSLLASKKSPVKVLKS